MKKMKTYAELKPGDIVYECDFDTDESETLLVEEVADLIEKYIVVAHSVPHRNGNLYLARIDRNSMTRQSEFGNTPCPVAYLSVPADEVATTPRGAVEQEAARRACYGQSHVRDAVVLREWAASSFHHIRQTSGSVRPNPSKETM